MFLKILSPVAYILTGNATRQVEARALPNLGPHVLQGLQGAMQPADAELYIFPHVSGARECRVATALGFRYKATPEQQQRTATTM